MFSSLNVRIKIIIFSYIMSWIFLLFVRMDKTKNGDDYKSTPFFSNGLNPDPGFLFFLIFKALSQINNAQLQ